MHSLQCVRFARVTMIRQVMDIGLGRLILWARHLLFIISRLHRSASTETMSIHRKVDGTLA